MNTDQMIKQVRTHPVMCEIGMEMVVGIPFFEIRLNKLYVLFLPHCERREGKRMVFYKPAYRIEFAFPFRHLCRFDNLVLEGVSEAGMLAFYEESEAYEMKFEQFAAEINHLSDLLLNETVKNGCPAANLMTKYRQKVLDAMNTLKLTEVYASEVI